LTKLNEPNNQSYCSVFLCCSNNDVFCNHQYSWHICYHSWLVILLKKKFTIQEKEPIRDVIPIMSSHCTSVHFRIQMLVYDDGIEIAMEKGWFTLYGNDQQFFIFFTLTLLIHKCCMILKILVTLMLFEVYFRAFGLFLDFTWGFPVTYLPLIKVCLTSWWGRGNLNVMS